MLIYCARRSVNGVLYDPVSCDIDISNCALHDLGGGYRAYVVYAPWSGVSACVIDSRTGVIFGGTLAFIKDQIREYNLRDYKERWETAIGLRDSAKKVPPGEFWPWIIQMLTEEHA